MGPLCLWQCFASVFLQIVPSVQALQVYFGQCDLFKKSTYIFIMSWVTTMSKGFNWGQMGGQDHHNTLATISKALIHPSRLDLFVLFSGGLNRHTHTCCVEGLKNTNLNWGHVKLGMFSGRCGCRSCGARSVPVGSAFWWGCWWRAHHLCTARCWCSGAASGRGGTVPPGRSTPPHQRPPCRCRSQGRPAWPMGCPWSFIAVNFYTIWCKNQLQVKMELTFTPSGVIPDS